MLGRCDSLMNDLAYFNGFYFVVFLLSHLFSAQLQMIIDCVTAVPKPRAGFPKMGGVSNVVYPTTQEVLNLAASLYLKAALDPSRPEKLNGFVDWLLNVKNVLIVATETGSLKITVECGSLQILQELWEDYKSGTVNEMAQKYLVTEDILNELNLTKVELTTTIPEEEYRACQGQLFLYSGELKGLLQACRFSLETMML